MAGAAKSGLGATAAAAGLALAVGLAFWLPAFRLTGAFPAPLDDVYIYFGFARSTALGHPLAWTPDTGFSSGATSLLYPLVLAPLWALGLRGAWLGLGAAGLTVACLTDATSTLARRVAARDRGLVGVLTASVALLALPLVDWTLYSGMEVALFVAVLARALASTRDALDAPAELRRRRQLTAGCWLALLPLARPESVVLAVALGVALAHGAGVLRADTSLARGLGPLTLTLGAQALLHHALTGEVQAAGAIRKLLVADPHLQPSAVVLEVARNLLVLAHQALFRGMGGVLGLGLLLVLACVALGTPETRRLALALIVGAVGALFLVALNATARFQNYRYAAPSLVMLAITAWLGASTLTRRRRGGSVAAACVVGCWVYAPISDWPKEVDRFARASRNIAAQQGEVAARLKALTPPPRRVFVGDAGAIPYLSELPALDGLGLGGYHRLPFARASRFGDDAVLELVERMPEADRPDVFAVYPGWWPTLTARFGERFDSVRIDDNVICAADEKVLYRANFAELGTPDERADADAEDELDIADLVDEARHELRFERDGDRVMSATRRLADGRLRWDGGRRIAPGGALHFRAQVRGRGSRRVTLRTDHVASDARGGTLAVRAPTGDATQVPLEASSCSDDQRFCELTATATFGDDDHLTLHAGDRELRVLRVTFGERARR